MRAVDDDGPAKVAVLRKLMEWGALPESDLGRMLPNLHLTTDDYRDFEAEGYLDMAFIGDEFVLSVTPLGRMFLEQA